MKTRIIIPFIILGSILNAQTWNTSGNTGTNSNTDFLGTIDNKNFIIKTNNVERVRIGSEGTVGINSTVNDPAVAFTLEGTGMTQVLPSRDGDVMHMMNKADNVQFNADILWLSYDNKYQPNNPGVITTSGKRTPSSPAEILFSLRANGTMVLGSYYNLPTCVDCSDYRLLVRDGIRTEKVKVDVAANNGWADYVFENDYKLMPLNELENFISKNKHLPEVPTTDEVVKNGVELKEMSILLLKKIEELTLHAIQQQKEIEQLKNRLKNEN